MTLQRRSSASLDWILDSGAYTAWRQKKYIDLNDYVSFVREYEHLFPYVVCLDTIPGVFGAVPSPAVVNDAAEKSYVNFIKMLDMLPGLGPERIIPVYHQGEELHHLERLVKAGAKYIGISPTNGLPNRQRLIWSREVLKILPKDIKTHGFGFSTVKPEECVFYSMDSSSWSLGSGYGWILATSTKGWTRVHVTSQHDINALKRLEEMLALTRKRVPDLPVEITAELLQKSGKARAIYQLLVQRAAVAPHRLYAPVLLSHLIPALRYWTPKYVLASYWYLRMKGTNLLPALSGPAPTLDQAIESLTIKRKYNANSKRRGKPTVRSLPGLS